MDAGPPSTRTRRTSKRAIHARSVENDSDLRRVDALTALSWERAPHLADLPWRLASFAGRMPARTCLFEDDVGTLLAWATLLFPWHCLDFAVRPGPDAERVADAVFAWAAERLAVEAEAWDEPLRFFAAARPDDPERIALIERHGFGPNPWNWRYLRLGKDLAQTDPSIVESPILEGFTIQPLGGTPRVEAYVACHRAAFGTGQVTAEWRAATIRYPRYEPELDLVAVTPDGEVVAFCVGWITPPLPGLNGGRIAQVEPLGVHPTYQRRGLARALLAEMTRRAAAHGAVRLEVDVDADNDAARQTYLAAGFIPETEIPFFMRLFTPRAG